MYANMYIYRLVGITEAGGDMGTYLNVGTAKFKEAINSQIYVDKTRMISYLNTVINTKQKYVCVSRPRRFGKTTTLDMLAAYYDC